jgi:hypothetical protein
MQQFFNFIKSDTRKNGNIALSKMIQDFQKKLDVEISNLKTR